MMLCNLCQVFTDTSGWNYVLGRSELHEVLSVLLGMVLGKILWEADQEKNCVGLSHFWHAESVNYIALCPFDSFWKNMSVAFNKVHLFNLLLGDSDKINV